MEPVRAILSRFDGVNGLGHIIDCLLTAINANPARQQRRQEAKEARFDEMDEDGDGSITKAEFMTLAENHHMGADADGDGRITPWEHRRRNWN